LVATTAFLSPQCKSQISEWNRHRRRPTIRSWDATNIVSILERHPEIMIKYSLTDDTRLIPPSFLRLSTEISKTVQAAYGTAEMSGQNNPALEASSALAELLTVRLSEVQSRKLFTPQPFDVAEDTYPWLTVEGSNAGFERFDRYGLRGLFATLRHVIGLHDLSVAGTEDTITVSIAGGRQPNTTGTGLLLEIANWADAELRFSDTAITICPRDDAG
jgi:hypothetical protein